MQFRRLVKYKFRIFYIYLLKKTLLHEQELFVSHHIIVIMMWVLAWCDCIQNVSCWDVHHPPSTAPLLLFPQMLLVSVLAVFMIVNRIHRSSWQIAAVYVSEVVQQKQTGCDITLGVMALKNIPQNLITLHPAGLACHLTSLPELPSFPVVIPPSLHLFIYLLPKLWCHLFRIPIFHLHVPKSSLFSSPELLSHPLPGFLSLALSLSEGKQCFACWTW